MLGNALTLRRPHCRDLGAFAVEPVSNKELMPNVTPL